MSNSPPEGVETEVPLVESQIEEKSATEPALQPLDSNIEQNEAEETETKPREDGVEEIIGSYEEEDEEEDINAPLKHVPCQYCPICGCPLCYCEFFGGHVKPKAEPKEDGIANDVSENLPEDSRENAPELPAGENFTQNQQNDFPSLSSLEDPKNQTGTTGMSIERGPMQVVTFQLEPSPAQLKKQMEAALDKMILITVKSRTKRKTCSSILHLDKWGINISDFMAMAAKRLATNCSFKTSPQGHMVLISGDVSADVIYLLTTQYAIDKKNITVKRMLCKGAIVRSTKSRLEEHEKEKAAKEAALAKEKAKLKPKLVQQKGPKPKPGTKKAQELARKNKK